jgi:hypothetical protein
MAENVVTRYDPDLVFQRLAGMLDRGDRMGRFDCMYISDKYNVNVQNIVQSSKFESVFYNFFLSF